MKFYLDEALNYSKQKNNQAVLFLAGKSATPIAIGFSDSDAIKINIRNNYEQLDGLMGSLGQQYNTIAKFATKYGTLGTYGLSNIDSMLGNITDKLGNADDENNTLGSILNGVKSATSWVSSKAASLNSLAQSMTQRSVDTADAYMSIFNGTGVSVSLSMYQYLITDSITRDINKELTSIINNLMGDYDNVGPKGFNVETTSEGDSFIGFTSPPHNFQTTLSALTPGKEPEGTLTLYLNGIRFRGLVIDDIDLERSKTRVRIQGGEERPLWVRLDYTFKSVVKYTKNDVMDWLNLK